LEIVIQLGNEKNGIYSFKKINRQEIWFTLILNKVAFRKLKFVIKLYFRQITNTFSQIYIQLVFAVQNRNALIENVWEDEFYKYSIGNVQNKVKIGLQMVEWSILSIFLE